MNGTLIGASSCTKCDYGYALATGGQAACLGCDSGTYADVQGLTVSSWKCHPLKRASHVYHNIWIGM
jgi:hypothetical protein